VSSGILYIVSLGGVQVRVYTASLSTSSNTRMSSPYWLFAISVFERRRSGRCLLMYSHP